jgi:chromosomal replication initiation ATPase DnaA
MTNEEKYASLLAKSAAETKEANRRREKGLAYNKPSIFATIRKGNDHDENVIIDTFAELAGVTKDEFIGYNNTATIANARHIMAYTLRHRLGMSLQQIGAVVKRDHSTVASSIRRAEIILRENPVLIEVIDSAVERAKREKK